jgi:hypothetical protein
VLNSTKDIAMANKKQIRSKFADNTGMPGCDGSRKRDGTGGGRNKRCIGNGRRPSKKWLLDGGR